MNRAVAVAALLIAYFLFRGGAPLPVPTPAPVSIPAPVKAVADIAAKMGAEDRASLSDAYAVLSRAIEANPTDEPVFPDTSAVRRAHRACMLYVWRAVLKNQPGEVAGLREALEGAVNERIGDADVPLNPDLQRAAAKAFADISASFR